MVLALAQEEVTSILKNALFWPQFSEQFEKWLSFFSQIAEFRQQKRPRP